VSVTIEQVAAVDVARVTGSIDGKTAPGVGTALQPLLDGTRNIVIDLSDVDYVSSAGLRLLLVAYRKVQATSRRIVLAGVSVNIMQVMSHTGFLPFFVLVPDAAAALIALAEAPS